MMMEQTMTRVNEEEKEEINLVMEMFQDNCPQRKYDLDIFIYDLCSLHYSSSNY
jgi:hypothetical protein